MSLSKRCLAEFIGTFWLVLAGCGAAVLDAAFPQLGIGFLGVAFAFGLAQLTMCYAIGHISGAHINPAVSVGLAVGKRFPFKDLVPYVIAQVAGAVLAGAVLYLIASGRQGFRLSAGFASNGYGDHSPGGYSVLACFACELVMTFMFVFIIHGATDPRAPKSLAGAAIGFGLGLIHLASIPVKTTAVNPPRCTGPAAVGGGWAIHQLWLFWVAPVAGGALAGLLYHALLEEPKTARASGA